MIPEDILKEYDRTLMDRDFFCRLTDCREETGLFDPAARKDLPPCALNN